MASKTLSDEEIIAAVGEIRQEQPAIGRAKIREILKERHQWQVSEGRLKRLFPVVTPQTASDSKSGGLRDAVNQGGSAGGPDNTVDSSRGNDINAKMQCVRFWLNEAHKGAASKALARELGLELPNGDPYGYKAGLMYPMRRLVVTGRDTPDNFRILFGEGPMSDIHVEARKSVLMSLDAQKGSPNEMLNSYLDHGCPFWAPRPANLREREEIQKQVELSKTMNEMMQNAGLQF